MSQTLISLIDAEIFRLQAARILLEAISAREPGWPLSTVVESAKPKRKLSPEGRKKIADAQRKR